LANEYVRYGAIPENFPEDAYHIAIAVINEVDYLLSWNFATLLYSKFISPGKSLLKKRNLKD